MESGSFRMNLILIDSYIDSIHGSYNEITNGSSGESRRATSTIGEVSLGFGQVPGDLGVQ